MKLTLAIPDDIADALGMIAEAEGAAVEDAALEAIRIYLEALGAVERETGPVRHPLQHVEPEGNA